MPQRPAAPRRSPGVQVRLGKAGRSGDTRDARDDATIIAWLQRIDMDMVRGATKYEPRGGSSPRGATPPGDGSEVRGLGDAFRTAERSVRDFTRTLDPNPLRAAFEAVVNGLRRMAGLALPKDVREATIASMQSQKTLAEVSNNFKSARSRQKKLNRLANKAANRYAKAQGQANKFSAAPGSARHRFAQQALATAQAARDRATEAKKRAQTFQTAQGWAQTAAGAAQSTLTSTQSSASTPLTAGSVIGGAARAVGSFAVAHPVVAAAAGLTAIGTAAAIVAPALWRFATGLFESNKAFSMAGPMAFVLAVNNIRDTLRDMRTGSQTAGTAGFLGKQLGDIKDLFQPIYAAFRNFIQGIAGIIAAVVKVAVILSPLYWLVRGIAKVINEIADIVSPKLEGESLGEWVQSVADAARHRHVSGQFPFEEPGNPRVFHRPPPMMGNVDR